MEGRISEEYLNREDTVLASVLNHIFDGVYIVNRRRHVLLWNKGAEELTGYSAREVKGRWCGDSVLNHVDENGNPMCNGNCPLVETLCTGQRTRQKVYPCHKSGKRFPTMTHVAPIRDESGEIIAAVEVFRDISQEEEFRMLQEKFNGLIRKYVSSATLDGVLDELSGNKAPSAELRDLTVLYLDVVAFTAFTEQHSPVEAAGLLNDIFGICDIITTRFQGDIDKFIGDCVMAVFVDANDAFNAAKAMLKALRELNESREAKGLNTVQVRIGINSGLAVQGNIGTPNRQDLTVIGDVVNTASRVQHEASPGTVCLSEATFGRLNDVNGLDLRGKVHLKNKAVPVSIYEYSGQ